MKMGLSGELGTTEKAGDERKAFGEGFLYS